MKSFKKILSAVLTLLMVVPMFAVGSFAEDKTAIEENWTTLGAKYSSSTYAIIVDKTTNLPRTDGFAFTENENGGIDVHVPTYSEFNGACPTAVLASTHATALDGLEVKLSLADDTAFITDTRGFISNFSLLWSKDPITAIYDPETGTGEGSAMYAVTNGMRNIGGPKKQGIYVIVGGGDPLKSGTKVASFVNIYMFDGKFEDAIDLVPGYRWTFSARNKSDVGGSGNNTDSSGISRGFESIDCSDGLTFAFRADTTLGYVTVINGTEFYKAKGSEHTIGYYPSNVKYSEDDRAAQNDQYKKTMEYARKDIDLSYLTTIEKGYVSVMTVGNLISGRRQDNCYQDFTLDTVNGVNAAEWDAHVHTWGDWTVTVEPTCVEGEREHTCSVCGKTESEKIAPVMEHTFTDWTVDVEPTCVPGERSHSCTRCNQTFTEELAAVREHSWSDWTVTTEPTPAINGVESHECSSCHTVETRDMGKIANPFKDVPSDKWFALPAIYCDTKGFMNGTGVGIFAPNTQLTRAMFVTILAKIAGVDASVYSDTQTAFTDVPTGKWYSGPVAWAVENGYSSGLNATTFGTNNKVTREQLATFFFAYANKNDIPSADADDLAGYDDLDKVSGWAKSAMGWAVGNGIITGTSSTTLSPKGIATRAQVATIVKKFVQSMLGDTEVNYTLVKD